MFIAGGRQMTLMTCSNVKNARLRNEDTDILPINGFQSRPIARLASMNFIKTPWAGGVRWSASRDLQCTATVGQSVLH